VHGRTVSYMLSFNTGCLLLSYSGNPGVNDVSYRGINGKRWATSLHTTYGGCMAHTGRRFQSESTLQDIQIVQNLHDLDVYSR
jgi:hypothetical protein